jgi:hypothetical protein
MANPNLPAPRTSNDDLHRSIEGSIAQVSVMWTLHHGFLKRGEPLEKQIVQFSSAVFDAIGANYPILRNARRERFWFIYFKGLLIANTHPREEMVLALRKVASENGFGDLPPISKGQGETAKPTLGRVSDAEALQQIACSLEQNKSRYET